MITALEICCPVDQVGFRVVGCGVLWYGLEMIIEHDALEGLNYYRNRIIVWWRVVMDANSYTPGTPVTSLSRPA